MCVSPTQLYSQTYKKIPTTASEYLSIASRHSIPKNSANDNKSNICFPFWNAAAIASA